MAMLLTSMETPSCSESCASAVSGRGEELLPDESVTGLDPEVFGAVMNGVNNEAIGLSKAGQEGSTNGVCGSPVERRFRTLTALRVTGTIIECTGKGLPWISTY